MSELLVDPSFWTPKECAVYVASCAEALRPFADSQPAERDRLDLLWSNLGLGRISAVVPLFGGVVPHAVSRKFREAVYSANTHDAAACLAGRRHLLEVASVLDEGNGGPAHRAVSRALELFAAGRDSDIARDRAVARGAVLLASWPNAWITSTSWWRAVVDHVEAWADQVPLTDGPDRDLVVAWWLDVEHIRLQSEINYFYLGLWGAHDIVGALHRRDHIESRLARLDDTSGRLTRAVAEVDDVFVMFTEHDPHGVAAQLADTSTRDGAWWWLRQPISGPARVEFDELRRARQTR